MNSLYRFPGPKCSLGHPRNASGLLLFLSVLCVGTISQPSALAERLQSIPPHEIRVEHQPGLVVLQLTTDDGKVNVYFPEGIRAGEPFSGRLEALGTVSSSAVFDYTMALGEQSAKVKDGMFRWKVAEDTAAHMRLRFTGYHGEELAVTDLPVLRSEESREPPLPDSDRFHLPAIIQARTPAPVFGPFDADANTTHVEVDGQELRVLAELPGKAIVEGPRDAVGMKSWLIRKGDRESRGETRVLRIEQRLVPITQQNGKTGKWRVTVSGLVGVTEDIPLKFEINLPQTGYFLSDSLVGEYFLSPERLPFISPSQVRKDGSFVTERTIERIVAGPLDAKATLVVPQDLHDLVEIVLRSPRHDWTKMPAVEHAAALKPYGDNALHVLAEFLTGSLPYEALTTLFRSPDQGAKWVIPHLTEMGGQPVDMAVDAYTEMALKDPDFKYKDDLRSAILKLVAGGRSVKAIYDLGRIGTPEDIPFLENACRRYGQAAGYESTGAACQAVLARFGVREDIEGLAKAVTTPGPFWSQDVQRAAYSERAEVIPALCLHIHDPGHWFGDYGVYPAESAKAAIVAIQHKKLEDDQIETLCTSLSH